MQDRQTSRSVRRGSVTGALILIVVGFMLLLYNLGYLPGDIWRHLWRFWPMILILVGADIALRGFPTWFALPVLLLVVIALIGTVWLLVPTLPTQDIVTETLSQDLGHLSQAYIRLELDHGTLQVERLGDSPRLLLAGQFIHDASILIQQEFSASGQQGDLRLADRYQAYFPFFLFLGDIRNDWTVELSPRIPLELDLGGDDCRLDLNLSDLALKALTAELDDCAGEVEMPATDGLDANLNLDGSELTVIVPSNAAAKVRLDLDDTELTIDSARFTKISADQYLSEGFEEAETKLDVTLQATDSAISIQ